jgi:hypothetical protein
MASVKPYLATPGERTQQVLACIIFLGSQELVSVSTFHQGETLHESQYGRGPIVSETAMENLGGRPPIETICPYSPAQTIGAMCDHGGPWDMDNFQAASQCKFQSFKLLD